MQISTWHIFLQANHDSVRHRQHQGFVWSQGELRHLHGQLMCLQRYRNILLVNGSLRRPCSVADTANEQHYLNTANTYTSSCWLPDPLSIMLCSLYWCFCFQAVLMLCLSICGNNALKCCCFSVACLPSVAHLAVACRSA